MSDDFLTDEIFFYECKVCGNVMLKLIDSKLTPQCCGRDMHRLTPAEVEASVTTHQPVYVQNGNKILVRVGKEEHPMNAEHYIQWILIKTNRGFHVHKLRPGEEPETCFSLCPGEQLKEVYEFCSRHKLFKTDVADELTDCPMCGI